MASNVCSSCGEAGTLVWDGYEGQEECGTLRVCNACGAVEEEGAPTYSDFGTGFGNSQEFRGYARSLPTKYVRYNHKSVAKGKLSGIQKTKDVASIMGLSTAMTLEATELFEKVYYEDSILYVHIDSKLIIAGCCVYIICRQHGWPVLMKYVAEIVNCQLSQFARWKKTITALFSITLPTIDPEELIPATCNKAGLSKTVEGLMGSIIQLCQKAWIAEGRDPGSVVCAASYIAWQAEEPVTRRKTSVKKFCDNYHVPFKRIYRARLSEMRSMMCELTSQIPWVNKDEVTPMSVAMYVKDVCTYQKQLLAGALAKVRADNNLPGAGYSGSESADSHSPAAVSVDNVVASTQDTSIVCDPYTIVVINKPTSEMRTTVQPSLAQGTNKLALSDLSRKHAHGKRKTGSALVAPSFKRARENEHQVIMHTNEDLTIDRDLDGEEVTEEDIPNSEMCMYIKTDEEVQQQKSMIVLLKQKD